MSLYKGNNLIAGHQVLYSTTGQNTDGAMTQKACTDTFADQSLSNIANTATKCIDGQWVYSSATIASSVTWTTNTPAKSYSLANYLPNDNYDYEVQLTVTLQTGATSANFINGYISSGNGGGTIARLATVRTRASNYEQATGQGTIYVPANNREIVYQGAGTSSNANGTYTLYVLAYRRVGTNV